jgi:hypothetical protein
MVESPVESNSDLLDAMPFFACERLSIPCRMFNNCNYLNPRKFRASPIEAKEYCGYFIAG